MGAVIDPADWWISPMTWISPSHFRGFSPDDLTSKKDDLTGEDRDI